MGSAVPSHVSLLILHTQAISTFRLNLVLTHGIPPDFRGGVLFFYLNRYIRPRLSPKIIGSRSGVPMAFTVEIPPTKGQKSSR